ncbi:serine hydrolase domain-containing protein [Mucilaginibacter rubeus]|uniref:Beta-lactamase family protein n=2 Tax=Mucilaginibacter rubeus TaxID=2027860 RepID=A0ABX7U776_9SPHI|nr:serine hydrolase domain-containing protein [Mucilaginibacter rubeus]QTE41981.1 beta-lactamase family protein [Mucilaginibacter rubeus]QTE48582.1 beta-lactamase family protein [Mucilaginibacter rubeus]QTE59969.1 beta-lactamase family protein [Mucilaginibacter rubeus]QTE60565.1 beta-lactamase family protein [Mucilaginibacter rubeus]QTF59330.1 beta-lactamase family protein [Mucilaginibacter rubeus]
MKNTYPFGLYSLSFNALKISKLIAIAGLLLFAACKKDAPSVPKTNNGTDTTGKGTGTGTGTGTGGGTGTIVDTLTPSKVAVAALDDEVNTFMTTYDVPAVSVAITKGEKLVYLKAYGVSNKSKGTKAVISDRYRLASCSKQFTAVAIMKLLEQGKIKLSDKVFGDGAILGKTYGTKAYGLHITDITVDQLLHHTSGGWGNETDDPMFSNPTMTTAQLITWTLDNRPLDHVPGTNYDYSNFGYCILGRVIEKITGQAYAEAVKTLVLTPIGITDMTIGGNTLADKQAKEVTYYGQSGEDPYAYNITRMDAHGGWVATAADLARFLVYIDKFPVRPDILTSASLTTMYTGSTANAGYGCGWAIAGDSYFHQGSLPGTATEQARLGNGFNFVILTNTRSFKANFDFALDQIFWKAYAKNPTWATGDLFLK